MALAPPLQHLVDAGTLIPGEKPLAVAADVFIPRLVAEPPTVLCCLPGGALTRGYYHLQASGGSQTNGGHDDFSFAAWMTSQGFIVVAVDPIGIGGSSRPRDGFELTPDVLVEANVRAVESIRYDLVSGSLTDRLPPLPGLRTVGVGHSMGAMLTAMQQARDHQHVAVMLLGFGTQGLPRELSAEAAAFAGDQVRARENVVRLARARRRPLS